MSTISVVIPTLDAEDGISGLLDSLAEQTRPADEVFVVDASLDNRTREMAVSHPGVRVIDIRHDDFSRGLARSRALRETTGEYVAFLAPGAVPVNDRYLENLAAPLDADPQVALVSGRQLPRSDAQRFESLVREFACPSGSSARAVEDLPLRGDGTCFVSDVCSCYRRDAYLEVEGFDEATANDGMTMAARLLRSGYRVAYAPDAEVARSCDVMSDERFRRDRVVDAFLAEFGANRT